MFKYTSFESSIFFIVMLYILIHTVLTVEFFVVVFCNRVYNLCTLHVLKGADRG